MAGGAAPPAEPGTSVAGARSGDGRRRNSRGAGDGAAGLERPALSPGVELIGEMEGSGFKEPPSIVRRADGQVLQLPALLYELVRLLDGSRGYDALARSLSERIHRGVGPDDARFLVREKLIPIGLVAEPDGTAPPVAKADPFLALKFRAAVVPERVTAALGRVFRPLFLPPLPLLSGAGLIALDVWLFGFHGVAQPLRQTLLHPGLILVLMALVVVSAAFHETGHATACSYSGAAPGPMGCGLYLAWPAFYTDVTDSYRLSRRGRLRTDLGGVYFNTVFALAVAGLYFASGSQALLIAVVLVHLEIAHQLIPVVRLDGYYVVSDITGVPDLFARIGPILSAALPWREADERVRVLKPWVRAAVTAWVLVIVPILLAEGAMILVNLPRIFGTGWRSAVVLAHRAGGDAGHGRWLGSVSSALQLLVLAIPLAGVVVMLVRGARSLTAAFVRATRGRPPLRAAGALAGAGILVVLALAWAPGANYRAIQPGERGTVVAGVGTIGRAVRARPIVVPVPATTSVPGSTRTSPPPSPTRQAPTTTAPRRHRPASPGAVTSTTGPGSSPSTSTTSTSATSTTAPNPASTSTTASTSTSVRSTVTTPSTSTTAPSTHSSVSTAP